MRLGFFHELIVRGWHMLCVVNLGGEGITFTQQLETSGMGLGPCHLWLSSWLLCVWCWHTTYSSVFNYLHYFVTLCTSILYIHVHMYTYIYSNIYLYSTSTLYILYFIHSFVFIIILLYLTILIIICFTLGGFATSLGYSYPYTRS